MLAKGLTRGVKQSKHVQLYEQNGVHSTSGIRATLFGGTGFLGKAIGSAMGNIGSDVIYPSKNMWAINDNVKRLRLTGNLGMVYIYHNMNFEDPRAYYRSMANSNIVVNCIGPRKTVTSYNKFKNANIDVPKMIAKQARLAGVKRLIHISSVGADPKSPSLDLQTKYYGEQEVLDQFPDATILRLCTVVGMNDYFQKIFRKQALFFMHFIPVFSDLTAHRQPITDYDVSQIVMNVIKLPESCGQIYEIGGPHVYDLKEINEIMMNIMQKPLTFAKINKNFALKASLIASSQFINHDDIIKSELDLIVQPKEGVKTCEDLLFRPASVIPTMEELMAPYKDIIGYVKDDSQI